MPVGKPVHRNLSGLADPDQRLQWLQTLFAAEPRVRVWDWEVRRQQATPTLETLKQLHGVEPDSSILLLLGADAFAGMQSWRGYPEHRDYCDVAIFSRRGCARPELPEWSEITADEWPDRMGKGRAFYVDVMLPDISATDLRGRLAAELPVDAYIPASIEQGVRTAYQGNI